MASKDRRRFLRELGIGAAALPFVLNLPSLGWAAGPTGKKQRLVVIFSPNGTFPAKFWPDADRPEFELTEILKPLTPFKDKVATLHGVCDKIRGDGDSHMRGIGCLLTGIELFPGNIQGGSHTPAGWASGHSIDQEIARYLQKNDATRTRFGSLEFGVAVPERADTWTRMVYSGANQPIAPIDDPYQMFKKLYGNVDDRASLLSVLDSVQGELSKVQSIVSGEDRQLLEKHTTLVRELEQELKSPQAELDHPVPELPKGVRHDNDNIPKICKMQIDLMVNSFLGDFTRVATLQITNSVGQPRMRWLGIEEGHHELSHEPDTNEEAVNKLVKINTWYCEQVAYLAERLAATPEPGGEGSMLDNTLIVWTNELGKGNSHTLDNIPFVLVGGAPNMKLGRALKFNKVPHNRLLLSMAHAFDHHIERFGNADHTADGPLSLT